MSGTSPIDYLGLAIRTAVMNVKSGGGPFGAVVLLPDGTFAPGLNSVVEQHDPTAHAEVVALRAAATVTATHDLSGAILYSSCAPCPMCLAAALWARVEMIVYAANPSDARAAGFDDVEFYHQLGTTFNPPALSSIEMVWEGRADRLEPFDAWAALPADLRKDY